MENLSVIGVVAYIIGLLILTKIVADSIRTRICRCMFVGCTTEEANEKLEALSPLDRLTLRFCLKQNAPKRVKFGMAVLYSYVLLSLTVCALLVIAKCLPTTVYLFKICLHFFWIFTVIIAIVEIYTNKRSLE